MSELEKIRQGDRRALAQAITLIESTREDHREQAEALILACLAHSGNSFRVGLTGMPGVGKSTLIEVLGNYAIDLGKQVAVLAVDPTSRTTGGAILGDKTRMSTLATQANAFIRPSPASGTLGGVARRTQECIVLCEAAGFDFIIVETVGVGQSEVSVADLTDIFILMLLPGGGDELQGMKRGVMELADVLLVNKADGDYKEKAKLSAGELKQVMKFMPCQRGHWQAEVLTISALEKLGLDDMWQVIERFRTRGGGREIDADRKRQAMTWLWSETQAFVMESLNNNTLMKENFDKYQQQVRDGLLLPSMAARSVVEFMLKH